VLHVWWRVQAYEARSGVAPDQPLTELDFAHDLITPAEFETRWIAAREELDSGPPRARYI
jgi:hypothetical protein